MIKNIKKRLDIRKKSELKVTPGENVRDAIIKAGIKAAEESGYAAGNSTEKIVEIATAISSLIPMDVNKKTNVPSLIPRPFIEIGSILTSQTIGRNIKKYKRGVGEPRDSAIK